MTASLNLDRVDVTLNGFDILKNVTFEVRAGEIVGIVGPNGAGKSTALRAALRLVPVASGLIELNGEEITHAPAYQLAGRIAYLPQDHTIHWPLSVRRLVALGRRPRGTLFTIIAPEDEEIITRAMEDADVAQFADRPVTSLSGGERARVLLARLFASEAPIILADEPVAALDPYYQIGIITLFRKIADRERGVAVVVHDLTLASRYCDRVVLMQDGHILAHGAPDVVLSEESLATAYGIRTYRGPDGAIVPVGQVR